MASVKVLRGRECVYTQHEVSAAQKGVPAGENASSQGV
jgi:hypothetical protein